MCRHGCADIKYIVHARPFPSLRKVKDPSQSCHKVILFQNETLSHFITKLMSKTRSLYPSHNISDDYLRQSQAAASYDATLAFALGYDDILMRTSIVDEIVPHLNLNNTIANLKMNGLAVSYYYNDCLLLL